MELLLLISLPSILLFNAHITTTESSTYYYQALNAELSIEEGAFRNFTEILNEFQRVTTSKDEISEIKIAKDCAKEAKCKCGDDFREEEDAVCTPNGRVSVNGSIIMKKMQYSNDLTNKQSTKYRELSEELTAKFSKYYSQLKWFQSLSIERFSKGSVKVEFQMIFDRPTNEGLDKINNITNTLEEVFEGNAELVTTGFVKITAPTERVKSHVSTNITCETNLKIGNAKWYLLRENYDEIGITDEIHDGTEVTLSDVNTISSAFLNNTSHAWRGTYTCEFQEGKVKHQAQAFLDIALLPEINIHSYPQFPNCNKKKPSEEELNVLVTCAIKNSTENYNISWTDDDYVPESKKYEHGNILYTIRKTIKCGNASDLDVSCKFTNVLGQSQDKSLTIPVITADSATCKKDGDWPIAKAGYEAKLPCEGNRRGERTRKCRDDGQWDTEISKCVNADLDDISARAMHLLRGLGDFKKYAPELFKEMRISTQKQMNTTANLDTSVTIFQTMYNVSLHRTQELNREALYDFLTSASNIINKTLEGSWNDTLAAAYLLNVNRLLEQTDISGDDLEDISDKKINNVKLSLCSSDCEIFNAKVKFDKSTSAQNTSVTGFQNLGDYLPHEIKNDNDTMESRAIVLQVNVQGQRSEVTLEFEHINRTQNHQLHCVVWDPTENKWSREGCRWGGVDHPNHCYCKLSGDTTRSTRSGTTRSSINGYTGSAFTVLMSKHPVLLPFIDELTKTGLIVSIVSLIICLVIEFMVWNTVVKSSIAHFRHTAVVNISLCLLLADSTFLTTAFPESTPSHWCRWLVVVKHYCFLAMFFWMLCLSLVLLHSLIFIFQRLRKKVYLGVSFSVGYVCPLIIVVLTVIAYDNGEADSYYLPTTCWLKYEGLFKGSFYAFVMPVGIIVGINILSMMVVIVKLLSPSVSESRTQDDKDVIRSILKAVIFLTPVFGVTWIFGFFVLAIDYTVTPLSEIVNYAFTVCNAFQGLFILLTACLGEKKVREALHQICRCNSKVYKTSKGDLSTSKNTNSTSLKKK